VNADEIAVEALLKVIPLPFTLVGGVAERELALPLRAFLDLLRRP
jgi:hypothetical protein